MDSGTLKQKMIVEAEPALDRPEAFATGEALARVPIKSPRESKLSSFTNTLVSSIEGQELL